MNGEARFAHSALAMVNGSMSALLKWIEAEVPRSDAERESQDALREVLERVAVDVASLFKGAHGQLLTHGRSGPDMKLPAPAQVHRLKDWSMRAEVIHNADESDGDVNHGDPFPEDAA